MLTARRATAACPFLPPCLSPHPSSLQGKKRKDTVCIVLADESVEEARIRMNKVGAAMCCLATTPACLPACLPASVLIGCVFCC